MRYLRVLGVFAVLAILLILAALAFGSRADTASASPGTALSRPAFLADTAPNDTAAAFIGEKLDAEAGISAWVQTGLPIDLNLVRGQFRTIETDTADYIIGSVPVPNYVEHYDPHVYIHKNGWVLAYYLKTDPAAKIVDVKNETIGSDKLGSTVANLAALAGTPAQEIAYYDFRFPNATHMLMVEENDDNGKDFNIQLPTGYSYNELSFATYGPNYIYIDDARVDTQYSSDNTGYGTFTLSQLLPGTKHTVEISYWYGVVVIIHRVP
jgi:hypothetical protein